MRLRQRQRGYLAIVLVGLVVLGGLVGVTVNQMSVHSSHATVQRTRSDQAFYLAEAGLAHGFRRYLNRQLACDAIWEPPIAWGGGQFRVRCQHFRPAPMQLAMPAAAGDVAMSLSDHSGLAPLGIVTVAGEPIYYGAIGTTRAQCEQARCYGQICQPPCLLGVRRGLEQVRACAHARFSKVVQDQRILSAQGGAPTLTHAQGRRELSLALGREQSQAWVVGDQPYNNRRPLLAQQSQARWRLVSWAKAPRISRKVDNVTYNAVHCLADGQCWAVGQASYCRPAGILHWNGQLWQPASTSALLAQALVAVTCTAADDCWAVGKKIERLRYIDDDDDWGRYHYHQKHRYKSRYDDDDDDDGVRLVSEVNIVHWDGHTWRQDQVPGLPAEDLYSVTCSAKNDCWAVGHVLGAQRASGGRDDDDDDKHGHGYFWGFPYYRHVSPVPKVFWDDDDDNEDDYQDGGAGGGRVAQAYILHWDGHAWQQISTPGLPARSLYSVTCTKRNDCWAVGEHADYHPTLLHWDGLSWQRFDEAGLTMRTLRGVSCASAKDCWAVGQGVNTRIGSDAFVHWDGQSWEKAEAYSGLTTAGCQRTIELYAVDCVSANDCLAVGRGARQGLFVVQWDGNLWRRVKTGIGYGKTLRGIARVRFNANLQPVGWHEHVS